MDSVGIRLETGGMKSDLPLHDLLITCFYGENGLFRHSTDEKARDKAGAKSFDY